MEHYELVNEMQQVDRMATQERLKHARKRRGQQIKKWTQYEKQLEKESTKKKKDKIQQSKKPRKNANIRFAPNIALLEAAARNDLVEVKRLLESGVSPDVTNEDGLTALHQCCIDDAEEMMKLLLDYNANVNACDSEMWTPLHAAATCGHVNLCKLLIDKNAELLAVNADGNMPYDICEDEVTLDHIETEMAKRGITQEQIDVTRLATEHKMLNDLKQYASEGGDLELLDQNGATFLHVAAANGYVEVAEFLLDSHVGVDTRDNESWQPIHAASYWAQQEIMEMLVEAGADLDMKTKNGETPFDLCEEPDLKQKILDMKDEIENKRVIRQQRQGSSRKHRISSRNTSMRRSSMRGDRKSDLMKKEHKEEALHFGLSHMHDNDSLQEAEEEHETSRVTDLDEVTIVVNSEDERPHPSSPSHKGNDVPDGVRPAAVTKITVNKPVKPTPKPRQNTPESSPLPTQRKVMADAQWSKSSSPDESRKEHPANTENILQHPQPIAQNVSQNNIEGGAPQPRHSSQSSVSSDRRQSASTLSDLKRHRSNSRENLLDAAVQNMFLESVQGGRHQQQRPPSHHHPGPEAGTDKSKNGHNNNNNSAMHYNAADGQLRRYVAPSSSPVVGGEEKHNKCCVIL